MYVFAMALAVGSTALYHLFQRATPAAAHPLVSLGVTYLAAALLCVLGLYLINQR
jgi:hypothetical protein